jgi:hypothetical protein
MKNGDVVDACKICGALGKFYTKPNGEWFVVYSCKHIEQAYKNSEIYRLKENEKTFLPTQENVILRAQLAEANERIALWAISFNECGEFKGPVEADWRPEKE